MAHAVRLDDLSTMSAADRATAIERLTDEAVATVNGQAVVVTARISAFESRYEMSSAQLIERLSREELLETAEIAEWLFWLQLRARSNG